MSKALMTYLSNPIGQRMLARGLAKAHADSCERPESYFSVYFTEGTSCLSIDVSESKEHDGCVHGGRKMHLRTYRGMWDSYPVMSDVEEQLTERQIDVIDQKDLERICEEVQDGLTVQYERFEY